MEIVQDYRAFDAMCENVYDIQKLKHGPYMFYSTDDTTAICIYDYTKNRMLFSSYNIKNEKLINSKKDFINRISNLGETLLVDLETEEIIYSYTKQVTFQTLSFYPEKLKTTSAYYIVFSNKLTPHRIAESRGSIIKAINIAYIMQATAVFNDNYALFLEILSSNGVSIFAKDSDDLKAVIVPSEFRVIPEEEVKDFKKIFKTPKPKEEKKSEKVLFSEILDGVLVTGNKVVDVDIDYPILRDQGIVEIKYDPVQQLFIFHLKQNKEGDYDASFLSDMIGNFDYSVVYI